MRFTPAPGTMLEGRYVLRAPLGHGGMGTVWRADHVKLGTAVAIKLIAPAMEASAEVQARFTREARMAAGLQSPNVVRILDFGVEHATPYIAMELLRGRTLGARLASGPPLDAATTLRIASQIARGVGCAHQAQIVHCDLKPENVFLAEVDGEEIAKVLDFGVAKATAPGHVDPLTCTGAVLGTLQYMSPEQLEARRKVDHRSDLYALGMIVFECLAGRPAFSADSLAGLVRMICVDPLPVPSKIASVPRGFDPWFARAAHRDPAERFQSARELSDALGVALATTAVPQHLARAAPHSTSRFDAPTELQPTAIGARRGGDERAGFRVTVDPRARLLEMELWGIWEPAIGVEFKAELLRAFAVLDGAPWVVLAFGSRYPPQKPEVERVHGETMAAAASYGMARTAFVIGSALAQMQAKRLATENKLPNGRFFKEEAEARAWLAELKLGA